MNSPGLESLLVKRRSALVSLAAAALWLGGCEETPGAGTAQWPVLPVRELSGAPATLAAANGELRLINVWALWCAPCRLELPSLERLAVALAPRGVQVCAVALAEDCFAVREYLAQHAARLRGLVLAPDAPQTRQLDLRALPQTFLVGPAGDVLARWTGAREWDSAAARTQLASFLPLA